MKPSTTTTTLNNIFRQPRLAVAFIALLSIAPAQADTGNCVGTNVNSWTTLMNTYNGAASDLTICLEAGSYTAGANERLNTPAGRTLTIDLNGQTVSITTPNSGDAAIRVTPGSGLIITDSSNAANGTLTATGGDYASDGAGIGGDGNNNGGEDGGTITINGGTVNANGGGFGDGGAGIGGGGGTNGTGGNGGNVTINGGTVNANGRGSDHGGAGIGGGGSGLIGSGGNGGSITINGGTVSASGSSYAAGIGGSSGGDGGSIVINAGTVSASGSYYAAGIGGGDTGNGGNVIISGGTISASGGVAGAGIGGGYYGNGASISISGGIITATGGSADSSRSGGAAIGSGGSGNSTAPAAGTLDFTGAAADDPTATLPSSYTFGGKAAATVPTPNSTTSTTRFWLFTENSGTPTTATGQSKVKIEFLQTQFTGTTVPGSGSGANATASFTGGGNACSFDTGGTAFIAKPTALPAEFDMPQGAFQFTLTGCDVGSTVTMTVSWPDPVGSQYRKWGKATSTATSDSLYTPDNLTTSGNSVTFTVTDGALGDDDWTVDGTITDPSGPLASNAPTTGNPAAIPSLGGLALALLALLLTGFGLWQRNSNR